MAANTYCQYIAFGVIFLVASIVFLVMAQGAYFPSTAQNYLMYAIGAAVFAVILFGVGIWQKKGEDKAPKHEIAKDDDGWSTSSS
ncbi:MAG: hypothetical protein ACFFCT_12130 [Candidatus Odinarchaeota archaeon]